MEHSLAVADCVVILEQLRRSGVITVNGIYTEPDCHVRLGGVDLKPDLYVDMVHPSAGQLRLWLEVDMASQGRKRMLSKFQMYTQASHRVTEAELADWTPWPVTLFIAVDEERRRELEYLLGEVPTEFRQLFRVTTRTELARILS